MKTLTLNIWERVQLATVMAQQHGNPVQYRRYIRVLDVVEMTEDEREAVGYETTVIGNRLDFNWKRGQEYELSFEDADWKTLVTTATSFKGWPTDRRVGTLLDKLGIATE